MQRKVVILFPDLSIFSLCRRLLEPWWLQKSGITTTEHVGDLPPITDDFDQSDFIVEELEGKSARFTEYSMSSSVLPRSEGMFYISIQ